jgi:hypothetical protein
MFWVIISRNNYIFTTWFCDLCILSFLSLQILVDRIRKYTWGTPWGRPNAQNKFKRGAFFYTFDKFFTFFGICEKLLTKSKMSEIRKILFGSLFISKIFEMKFWSLHHFDIWFKCWIRSCRMNGWPFVKAWWHFGSDFSRPTVELLRSIVMIN